MTTSSFLSEKSKAPTCGTIWARSLEVAKSEFKGLETVACSFLSPSHFPSFILVSVSVSWVEPGVVPGTGGSGAGTFGLGRAAAW